MIPRSSRFIVTLFVCLLLIGSGCKSKKKAMEAKAAAEKARMEQETADKKKREEEEARKKREEEERQRAEADAEAKRKTAASTPAVRLDQYFNAIAGSSNPSSANGSINEALSMFASPQTPVLIVIAEEGGMKDYDKPTTIQAYLNYLKDQKKNLNTITDLKFDGAGKITEVELTKKK